MALLFAKYAREVAKALPSDKAYPLRGSEKSAARASEWRHNRSVRSLLLSNCGDQDPT
jgi:hypothetical protein